MEIMYYSSFLFIIKNFFLKNTFKSLYYLLQTGQPYAGVAQLARAPVCHTGGCGFESRHPLV